MRAGKTGILAGLLLTLAGCVADDFDNEQWALRNPFRSEPGFNPAAAPKASPIAATRVHSIGSAIVHANKADLQTTPVFSTVGLKEPMIFHRSGGNVVLSEGLVELCPTDAELAAVICSELGKMAAKENRAGARGDGNLPPAPPPPSDVVGAGHSADMTRVAEQALYDRRGSRGSRPARESRPDPRTLAQDFLTKAGHSADDLERVSSLLKEAEENAERRDILKNR
jgi:hypothetical protein